MNTYEERQIFKLRWIFIPISLFTILPVLLLSNGSSREGLLALSISVGVLLLSGLLLFSMKQTIRIDEKGVHYQQRPFHRSFRSVPWSEIKEWKVEKISPLGDFGGWGIRINRKKMGYIIDGNYGLGLKTAAKKHTVLSIVNKEEAIQAMNYFGQFV